MADQCIVCLENLDSAIPLQQLQGNDSGGGSSSSSDSTGTGNGSGSGSSGSTNHHQQPLTDLNPLPLAAASPTASSTTQNATTIQHLDGKDQQSTHDSEDHIAVIQVCGHILHDTCLKAWTGKANSCPICRQAFHLVEVYDKIGGNLLDTYQVEDKKQVAEFDPLAWLDENPEEEEESRPCIVCNSAEHEDLTLLCDGCDTPYHTHCIGLERVPEGSWLCMECADRNGFVLPFGRPPRAAGRSRSRRVGFFPRTQASMRNERTRARTDQWLGAWGQFSSHILGASGIDLDSNDDGDDGLGEYRRSQQLRERERREWQRWQQRLHIASRLGAGDVFARNIQDGVEHQVAPSPQQAAPTATATTQTREERQAWRDFERARAATPGGRKRKSRSVTASPVEPVPEPARPLKRPRTRRIAVQTEAGPSRATSAAGASSSNQLHSDRVTTGPSPTTALSPAAAMEEAPSFLSSLLQEVEQTAPSDNETVRSLFGLAHPVDPSSPMTSPSASTHNSPRAMSLTPPPQPPTANAAAARSASRSPGLSSHIEPRYPPANYSPTRSNGESSDSESRPQRQQPPQTGTPELRQPRPRRQLEVRLPRSQDVSPTRKNLPLEVKENISQVVRAALKPHWKSSQLSADQYATINRNISHRIYEEVKDPTSVDDDAKRHWEKIATSEVARAVAELKS